ncbi:tRNA (N(6)-L-threonylcarbamoyladenosine(37)-C(2))-methylthiotransferase MtaB [Novosphingobium sp. PC22D]|uniref:MiaB/RimO family radical SAM methylthiotransferase n=1 Tax=Novosphingobium sp. PC22D TaxID=1962403 RepID=UPI000BEF5029|nr:MiaB/RimO family radical SAM methylthiotransferase [Novosphingobium sp. PC22D]PEQ10817.1 tRNA (N(6)-L-threonylcarbamoyladenosine(37)-C(2))-methylthiotransferase MtaB [Novosphingobium sp. PC22D]
MSVTVHSLGCRLNLSESETLRGLLAPDDDLVVVNSCAVTAEAMRQTRQTIRRARRERPAARLLVTGCAAEVEREAIARMPEVDGLVPNQAKLDPRVWNVPAPVPRPQPGHDGAYSRAFVAVQNGCDHACTFCVIPQGRGPARSRPVAEVLETIGLHLEAGAREVVLTGVDLSSWGPDLRADARLGELVAAILRRFPKLPRLRLSSIDGAEIDAQLLDLLAHEPRLMPHLHLSLQSGDDMILKRMKRRHTRRDAAALVETLRAARPDLAVGADLIAGFPTEDEAMHAANLSAIADLGIVHGHVFPYSPRAGTPAARMPQVARPTIKARAAELRAAVAAERMRWLEGLVGTPLSVLAESDGTGHAANFAPVRLPEGTARAALIDLTPRAVVEGMLQ